MQLTLYTDYSLRVLIYLMNMSRKSATINEVADFYKISRNHLVKVSHQLARKGFIVSQRGKGGGISLARPPESIRINDVVQAMEPNFYLVECFNTIENQCQITNMCQLKGLLNHALMAFFKDLDQYTLASLRHDDLARRLNFE